jgi:hypothetical protein
MVGRLGLIWNANKNAPETGFVFELEKLTVTGTRRAQSAPRTLTARLSKAKKECGTFWRIRSS